MSFWLFFGGNGQDSKTRATHPRFHSRPDRCEERERERERRAWIFGDAGCVLGGANFARCHRPFNDGHDSAPASSRFSQVWSIYSLPPLPFFLVPFSIRSLFRSVTERGTEAPFLTGSGAPKQIEVTFTRAFVFARFPRHQSSSCPPARLAGVHCPTHEINLVVTTTIILGYLPTEWHTKLKACQCNIFCNRNPSKFCTLPRTRTTLGPNNNNINVNNDKEHWCFLRWRATSVHLLLVIFVWPGEGVF